MMSVTNLRVIETLQILIGMLEKVTFVGAMFFIKLSVYLAWTWPHSENVTKRESTKYDILSALSFINVSCLVLASISGIYVYSSNSVAITQLTCFVCAGFNYIIKTILYKVRRKRLQKLLYEMENYCTKAQSQERDVLQNYLDSCSFFYVVITVMNYLTAIAMGVGPLIFDLPLDNFAVYPFSIVSDWRKYSVYAHQVIAFFQYSAAIASDCQMAIIMWYVIARLEILAVELKDLSTIENVRTFVQKHQRLLSYADEVSDTVSYVALTTSVMSGIATVMSCTRLISSSSIAAKMQYGPLIGICIGNLFVLAWPAEHLLRVCNFMATSIYTTSWTSMTTKSRKDILVILRRSQRPVKVSIGGFMPTLSLGFYGSFLSAAYSYFTTLRAVLQD